MRISNYVYKRLFQAVSIMAAFYFSYFLYIKLDYFWRSDKQHVMSSSLEERDQFPDQPTLNLSRQQRQVNNQTGPGSNPSHLSVLQQTNTLMRQLQQQIQTLQTSLDKLQVRSEIRLAAEVVTDPVKMGAVSSKPSSRLTQDLDAAVNVVPSVPAVGLVLPYKDCVPLPGCPRPGVVICIHDAKDDIYVSGSLKKNKLWEAKLILTMQGALEADRNMMLLDLGCNIGEYTLWVAAMGRSVVAVEMLISNVQLVQTSLNMSGLSQNVTLVNNAVYRDHRTLGVEFMLKNIGGTRLNTSKIYEHVVKKGKVEVGTICMDDLLPLLRNKTIFIKMDIENSEHHALACAHKLFDQTNIKIVQMEWMNKAPEEAEQVKQFMDLHSYAVSKSPLSYEPLQSLGGDVYFLKKSVFNIL